MPIWTRVARRQAQGLLDRLGTAWRQPAYRSHETDVQCRELPFYGRYRLYRLTHRATLPAFALHCLSDGEHFVALDGTANPIYTVSEQDPVRLTEATLLPYVEFFFSHVQGSEGEIYFVNDPRSAPLLATLDDAQRQTLLAQHRPLTPGRDVASGHFTLSGTLHYGGALINATARVSDGGKLAFDAMSIVLPSARPPAFLSCFISHSFADAPFALKLNEALVRRGVKTWLSQKDALGGQQLHAQLRAGIGRMDKLLVVLSEHSLQSPWVGTEILEARQRERSEGRSILFPIRITDYDRLKRLEIFDADEGRDLGREIRGFYIPDFTQWQDEARFGGEFDRLLEALRRPVIWRLGEPR